MFLLLLRRLPAVALCLLACACRADLIVADGGQVTNGTLDLGTTRLLDRTEIETTFVLKNTGDAPISLVHLGLPCACLTAHVERETGQGRLAVIAPGATLLVHLNVNLHRLPTGAFRKNIDIYTEGAKTQPAATLQIVGKVIPPVRFDPPALPLGEIKARGVPREITVIVEVDERLVQNNALPLLVAQQRGQLRVRRDGPMQRDTENGVVRQRYAVSLGPKASQGVLETHLRFQVKEPVPPALAQAELPVSGIVTGEVTPQPRIVALGAVAPGTAIAQHSVRLTAQTVDALRNLRVEVDAPWLTARLDPLPRHLTSPPTRVLRVGVVAGGTEGLQQSRITIVQADGQRLTLPVSGYILPPRRETRVIRSAAPNFTLPNLSGKAQSLARLRAGRPTALFFFCGCDACARVAAAWGRLQRGGLLNAFSRTVIVYHKVSPAGIKEMARLAGLSPTHTTLLRDTSTPGVGASLYDASQCPRLFILDQGGKIRYTNTGKDDGPEATTNNASLIAKRGLGALQAVPRPVSDRR